MSWASHRSEKSRRRKTANIDGAGAAAAVNGSSNGTDVGAELPHPGMAR